MLEGLVQADGPCAFEATITLKEFDAGRLSFEYRMGGTIPSRMLPAVAPIWRESAGYTLPMGQTVDYVWKRSQDKRRIDSASV